MAKTSFCVIQAELSSGQRKWFPTEAEAISQAQELMSTQPYAHALAVVRIVAQVDRATPPIKVTRFR